jgi:hypothetical protein
MRGIIGAAALVACAVACGGPSQGAKSSEVVICPAGSVLDPQKQQCVAMEHAHPVDTGEATEGHVVNPALRAANLTLDVACAFPKGWVALLPASEYPKDDEFLMQALIGFTQDPSFWSSQSEYKQFAPYAAKSCGSSPVRLVAPAPGDYYLLAGQEDTFSLRGKYDKNGLRKKITLTAPTSMVLSARDLTFTWDCISCPWVVFRGAGRDLEPFVVLANRRGRDRRGTDVHRVARVPVQDGLVTLRVVEIEREATHLDALVLRVNGQRLVASSNALDRDDGTELRLGPRTQATVTYRVPGAANPDGFVDVEVEATGYYDPL